MIGGIDVWVSVGMFCFPVNEPLESVGVALFKPTIKGSNSSRGVSVSC